MIKPAGLKPEANIGVISPSYWIAEDVLKNTAEIFSGVEKEMFFSPKKFFIFFSL